MNDLLICVVPYLETYLPPAAPAILKGHLQTRGFKVANLDLNLHTYENVENLETYNQLVAFFSDRTTLTDNLQQELDQLLTKWYEKIISVPTKILGISVFSHDSRRATECLVKWLKNKNYPVPIVLGGQGVEHTWAQKIGADYWIVGEGELALEELLTGNFIYPGINQYNSPYNPNVQIDDLDQLGPADYSDYDLSKYVFYDKSTVQITGSRGCVRKCTFCDVYQKWPKFRWRSGKSIANEIIKLNRTHNVDNFYFTDSLINGNMKSFIELCELLADYKKNYAPALTWGGQFIVRKLKGLPSNYFNLLADSGAHNLTIGVETGSDRVRAHIKKGFDNVDLDYHMEQFSNLGITCSFLMLLGYPTETEEDFEETLKMLVRYHGYASNGTILGITLGSTLVMNQDVPLVEMYKDTLFSYPEDQEDVSAVINWQPKEPNITLTLKERIRRRLVAGLVAQDWGWNVVSADRELQILKFVCENGAEGGQAASHYIKSQG